VAVWDGARQPERERKRIKPNGKSQNRLSLLGKILTSQYPEIPLTPTLKKGETTISLS
jgi:hypothetical protein